LAEASRLVSWRIALGLVSAGAIVAAIALLVDIRRAPERVILIVIDTLRRDHLPVYGGETRAPHIEALAERGQVFERALASFHQTTMSMGSLFTGRTPSFETADPRSPLSWNGDTWCGLARFAGEGSEGACIPAAIPTLAEQLSEAGYWTIGVASNQLLFEPSNFSRGFDDWVEVGDRPADTRRGTPPPNPWESRYWGPVNAAAIEALNRRQSDQFFLYVHYMDVHDYGLRPVPYTETILAVDEAVGRLLHQLEGAGLMKAAVVILTSDHGERLNEPHPIRSKLGHYGNPSFQELLEVPLIVAPPLAEDAAAPLRTQDLHYLIREIAGLRPASAAELDPEELFVGELHYRTYLKGRWKSTIRREDGKHFLFDLEADPGERRDVAAANPQVAAAHRGRIEALSRELAAGSAPAERELSELERETLRMLGYAD
jgi:arylsulfatase A-like enzyme